MRFCCLVIVLALLAAFASDSWGQSKRPPQPQAQSPQQQTAAEQRGTENLPVVVKVLPAQETEEKAKAESKEHDEKRQLDRDTLWLSAATVAIIFLQLLIFVAQAYFLWGTLAATATAANAAKLAAQAAVAVDLPILAPSMIALHREPGVPGLVQGYPERVSTFKINFKNFGRTAAELVTQCIEWKVVSRLPEIPVYKSSFPFVPGTFVEYGNELPAVIQNFIITLQPEEVEAISKETTFLWVYGYVLFKDFLGNGHEQRWCTKWQAFALRPDGARGPLGFVYDSATPSEYTKRT
jgi:hypothetical protein